MMDLQAKKQFAIKTLNFLKLEIIKRKTFSNNGIEVTEFIENYINKLEESVVMLFAKDDKQFELILNDVQWWLYEDVKKVIYYNNKKEVKVDTIEKFINWIIKNYDVCTN